MPNTNNDENYIIDLCDEILGHAASRQHRFDFLLGDPGKSGRRTRLPVDAYYQRLELVIEYHERQHTEAVPIFDRRQTISGVSRGEQRKIYDQRRQKVLPMHGITCLILDVGEFAHTRRRRLTRDRSADCEIIKRRLSRFLPAS